MLTSPQIELARGIAFRAHEGQLDKIKAPYIEHPQMVAFFVQLLPDFESADPGEQEAAVCAAWLHDVVEDTAVTSEVLQAIGINSDVVSAVVALTRTDDVPSEDYYATIRSDPVARLVKTADIASNLAPERVAELDSATRERLQLKYSHALELLGVDRQVMSGIYRAASGHRARSNVGARGAAGMVIDLHTHSDCSDGTDSPRALVGKAHQAGITVLAITDHDTSAGWGQAAQAAGELGVQLIRGIELSTKNEGHGQHLLAYGADPQHPALAEILRRGRVARESRIPKMVELIRAKEPRLRLEDVLRIAGNAIPGKPHIADALVACGAFTDRREAFSTYLVPGVDTCVVKWAPSIEDAISAVTAAGGATVVAHPWGRKPKVTERRFEQLRACGLRGIEVNHYEHDDADRRLLTAIAMDLGLIITGSSDFHGSRKPNRLACETTDPDQFERLQSLWSGAAQV